MEKAMTTLQKQFNKVALHLITQNEKSTDHIGICRYRGPNGLTCAAGCMIPDELYESRMEMQTWPTIVKSIPELEKHLDVTLGYELQRIHDAYSVDIWPEKLKELAEELNLEIPEFLL